MMHHGTKMVSVLAMLVVVAVAIGLTEAAPGSTSSGSNDGPTATISTASSTPEPETVVATDDDYASSIGIRSFTVAVTSASERPAVTVASTWAVPNITHSQTTPSTSSPSTTDYVADDEKVLNFESESTPPPLNELTANGAVARDQNGLFRIKIAEIITDEFDNGLVGEGSLDDEEDVKRRMALHQQNNAYNGGKIQLADLYPSKLEDFGPIIKQSNERLINEKHMFVQEPEDGVVDEMRGRVVLNSYEPTLDDVRSDMPSTKIEIELIDDRTEGDHTINTDNDSNVSEFTKQLLRDSDGIINTIERTFINVPKSNIISGEAEIVPAITINKPIDKFGFIDRRVKKMDPAAFKIPHEHVKPKPEDEEHSSNNKPEFSTTKFYNSKELYSELLHKKIEDVLPNDQIASLGTPTPIEVTSSIPTTVDKQTIVSEEITTTQAAVKSSSNINTPKTSSPKFKKLTKKVIALGKSSSLNSKGKVVAVKLATSASTQSTDFPQSTTTSGIALQTTTESEDISTLATSKERPPITQSVTTKMPDEASSAFASSSTSTTTSASLTSTKPPTTTGSITLKNTTPSRVSSSPSPIVSSSTSAASPTTIGATTIATTKTPTASTATTTTTTSTTTQPPSIDRNKAMVRPPYTANGASVVVVHSLHQLSRLQEKINSLECEMPGDLVEANVWRGNETHELALPNTIPENCSTSGSECMPMVISWEGTAEIQSGDVLIVEIDDSLLVPDDNSTKEPNSHKATTAVYQVTRPGHEHCDVTEGVLLDITPLEVDGKKLVTLYDKDLTEGVNLLIVVSELWGTQCVRLKVTVKSDNCGESADCSGKGVCYSNASMEGYECQCCTGFAGPHCEEIDACSPSPCTNNGICVDLSQGHEGNSYQCLCPYGYAGKNCQFESDPCNPSECQNGGSCAGNATHFRCDCAAGYGGQFCQHNMNECESSPCVHGICVDQEDGFRCFCQPGFAGELCNFEYNECDSNPCLNGGQCADHICGFACKCTRGYTGKNCHIKVDFCANNPCPEGHRCNDRGDDFTCECPGGRNGPDCNQVPRTLCNINPCANGGTCWTSEESFYCACRPGFTGKMCEDEFVIETVVSSNEMLQDEASNMARPFGESSYSAVVASKEHIGGLHNAYVAAGTFATAIFIVAIVVIGCHCKFNQTYRRFTLRNTPLLPSFPFGRRSKTAASNRHWLSGKGVDRVLAGSSVNLSQSASHHLHHSNKSAATGLQHYNNVSTPPLPPHHLHAQQHQTTCQAHPAHGLTHLGRQQMEHRNQFNRHLAQNLENDMYYTVDFSESQQSPLIQ